MNILHVVSYKYLKPNHGGSYGIFYPQKYLSKRVNLFVAGSKANEVTKENQFTHFPIFSNHPLRYINPLLIGKIIRIVRENNIEAILFDHPYLAWLAYVVKKITKIPLIIRSNNIEYERFRTLNKKWWPLMKRYETWAHKTADFVWCVTKEDAEQIRKDIGKSKTKVLDLPYGTELMEAPKDKQACRKYLLDTYHLKDDTKLMLFNGSLGYTPNRNGLDAILQVMNPIWLKELSSYKIIICGSNLPAEYDSLKSYQEQNVIYAGFVEDISVYFKGVDVFLNPVVGGGGIKTKLVEALAFDTQSISTENGAIGLYEFATGNRLSTVKDYDWNTFAQTVMTYLNSNKNDHIPPAFYQYYNWEIRIKEVVKELEALR